MATHLVMARADQGELVRDLGLQREEIANLDARDAGRNRLEDTAVGRGGLRLEIVGFELARAAMQIKQDDRRLHRGAARDRSRSQDVGQTEAGKRQGARLQELAPLDRPRAMMWWESSHWAPWSDAQAFLYA